MIALIFTTIMIDFILILLVIAINLTGQYDPDIQSNRAFMNENSCNYYSD